ncbi:MAG: Fic family protein [Candidatus Nanoarchaeia archaeon]
MVYIYKKPIGNNTYYYLRASERKGNKSIVKDLAYLGTSLEEVKTALNKLPEHSNNIRKTYKTIHTFLESNHYLEKIKEHKLKKDDYLKEQLEDIEACKLHYTTVFTHQPDLTKQEILKNFLIEFAYNTTSIEGNTITLQEARNLLQDGLTPKNKTLREIYDLQNTEKVFFQLLTSHEEVTHQFIINLHKELMNNIDPRIGYRTTDVRVIKANFKATPAPYVKTDMGLLLDWYKKNKNNLHPFVLATAFHHKFERIHPFLDGNGRTGRMLLNYLLLKNNYPPTIIHKKTRTTYLKALREADKADLFQLPKDHYQELIQFTAEELATTYWNIFL